ncbi:NAD(P)H-binding protein [Tistrella bauzanensis]
MDGIDRRALILGAAGSFGGAVAQELGRRGWRLRLLVRDPAHLARLALAEDAEIVVGDARDPALVAHAAEGTDAIVHAVNLPWQHWEPAMRRITAAAVTAAREAHIRLVFPGNVYGFGRQDGRPLHEAAERRATTAKGRLRIALEQTIEDLGDSGAAPVLILRAGDFYGPTVRNRLVEMIFGRLARGRPRNGRAPWICPTNGASCPIWPGSWPIFWIATTNSQPWSMFMCRAMSSTASAGSWRWPPAPPAGRAFCPARCQAGCCGWARWAMPNCGRFRNCAICSTIR